MGDVNRRKRKDKRGRDPQSYLSKDNDKRARQLANLKQGDAPKQWGQTYSLKYGASATDRTLPVAGKAALIYEELADAAPLRDRDGSVPKADRVVVELFALCLARLDACTTYLAMHGPLDLKGKVRPAAVNGHRVLPNGGHEFPHWWPSFLPAGGHESPHQRIDLFACLVEWLDPLAGGCLRESVAVLPVGD